MSLEKLNVVDSVGTEKDGHTVVLSILDSWNWDNENQHLVALQSKLNTYFSFVETGQIYEDYPDAKGKLLRIDIISRYPIPEIGLTLLQKTSVVALQIDVVVTQRMH